MSIVPISDRRARLAVILSLLGFPSLGVTLPAAVWLGVGSVRQQRLSSGGEPAMGFLALVIVGLDLLLLDLAVRRLFEAVPIDAAWSALAWVAALAAAVVLTVASSLRIHPERSGVLLASRAALVASLGGGTTMFVQVLAVIQR